MQVVSGLGERLGVLHGSAGAPDPQFDGPCLLFAITVWHVWAVHAQRQDTVHHWRISPVHVVVLALGFVCFDRRRCTSVRACMLTCPSPPWREFLNNNGDSC